MAETSRGSSEEFPIEDAMDLLARGEMEIQGLLTRSSNYTFLVDVRSAEAQTYAVYKPSHGERPLWDFPSGTLAYREVAAYVVSHSLGWSVVPPTIFRVGPRGPGMVQLYIDVDPRENYFTLARQFPDQFKRLAVFDALINNADRKAGHCLRDANSHIWGIDHGVCFHEQPKLRTVIWEFAGSKIPVGLMKDLQVLRDRLMSDSDPLTKELGCLLAEREVHALIWRADRLIKEAHFPAPNPYERNVPWPEV